MVPQFIAGPTSFTPVFAASRSYFGHTSAAWAGVRLAWSVRLGSFRTSRYLIEGSAFSLLSVLAALKLPFHSIG